MRTKDVIGEKLPTTWSYEPPNEAPVRAHCSACGESAVVLQPRVANVATGRYVIEGHCKSCTAPITFVL